MNADKFALFEEMYAKFTAFIYEVLAIFGIVVNEEGNLEKAE